MLISSKNELLGNTTWNSLSKLTSKSYTCGYCGNIIASDKGYWSSSRYDNGSAYIYICPFCGGPTLFSIYNKRYPDVMPGDLVDYVPEFVNKLYNEARTCAGAGAYTASVMVARTLLMYIAIEQKAKPGESFVYYVDYLEQNQLIPRNGKEWVDHIRKQGNEAVHELKMKSADDAEMLITFLEMLLRLIYEFPSKVPKKP